MKKSYITIRTPNRLIREGAQLDEIADKLFDAGYRIEGNALKMAVYHMERAAIRLEKKMNVKS